MNITRRIHTISFILIFCLLLLFNPLAKSFSIQSREEILPLLLQSLEEKITEINIDYNMASTELHLEDIRYYIRESIHKSSPYIKNTISSWNLTLSSQGNEVHVEILFEYLSSRAEDLYVYQHTKTIVDDLITNEMDSHQIVKILYDYVVKNVEYDYTWTYYSAYEALQGQAVCQGYALLLFQLLEKAGLESTIIRGELSDGNPHAWNMVYLDGHWYHLDATQDSTSYHIYGEIFYNYYALMDTQIGRSHLWRLGEYPRGTTEYLDTLLLLDEKNPEKRLYNKLIRDLNLHFLLDEYTTFSQMELKDLVKKAVLQREPLVSMRSFNPLYQSEVFSQIFSEIVREHQEVGQYLSGYTAKRRDFHRDTYSNSNILTLIFEYR